MISQADRAARFTALHEQDGMFLMPNPWTSDLPKSCSRSWV